MKYILTILGLLYGLTIGSQVNNLKESEVLLKEVTIKARRIMSDEIIEHIKSYEKFESKPYTLNHRCIGYGHLIQENEVFDSISEQEAANLLIKDFLVNYNIINKFNISKRLSENKKLALTLLAFNVGAYKIPKWNLYDSIASNGDCSIWLNYCLFRGKKHKRLRQRRLYEYKLFIKN